VEHAEAALRNILPVAPTGINSPEAGTFAVLVYMNEHQVAGFFVRPPGA
jgi:hypothetical protein